MGGTPLNLRISPTKVATWLAAALGALLFLHGAAVFIDRVLGHPKALGFNNLFYLSAEDNVPTLYSSLLMWTIAGVACVLADTCRKRGEQGVAAWLGIAILFGFLGIDESASLHEKMSGPLRDALGGVSGYLYFAYILPYGIAFVVLTIVYMPFVLRLPPRTRVKTVVSAAVYVTGALVFEAIGGEHYRTMDVRDATYIWMITLEEVLEIAGLSIFLWAQADYVVERFGGATIVVEDAPGRERALACNPASEVVRPNS